MQLVLQTPLAEDVSVDLRVATLADVGAIRQLIGTSVRGLSADVYTSAQIEAALIGIFGVDSQLIRDETYYVIEDGERLAAAGGWSGRRTLYGGDQAKEIEDPVLDPRSEPARIRAFFVHPVFARRGLARQLYTHSEGHARAAGFRQFELMATLPGEPLYTALGFSVVEPVILSPAPGVTMPFIRMMRDISRAAS